MNINDQILGSLDVFDYNPEKDTRINVAIPHLVEGGYRFNRLDIPREAITNVVIERHTWRPTSPWMAQEKVGGKKGIRITLELDDSHPHIKDSFGNDAVLMISQFTNDPAGELEAHKPIFDNDSSDCGADTVAEAYEQARAK